MIKQLKMYTVVCDNCGTDAGDDADYSCWEEEESAWDVASDSGWIMGDNKATHYCPQCVEYDDNDNLVLNESRRKAKERTK